MLIDVQGVGQSKKAEHERTLAAGTGRDSNGYIYWAVTFEQVPEGGGDGRRGSALEAVIFVKIGLGSRVIVQG